VTPLSQFVNSFQVKEIFVGDRELAAEVQKDLKEFEARQKREAAAQRSDDEEAVSNEDTSAQEAGNEVIEKVLESARQMQEDVLKRRAIVELEVPPEVEAPPPILLLPESILSANVVCSENL